MELNDEQLQRGACILKSSIFRFLVGPELKIYRIHALLACNVSPVLSRLIGGDWKESKAGEVVLDDIDEDTFVRFWQYAYVADYTVPQLHAPLEASMSTSRSISQTNDKLTRTKSTPCSRRLGSVEGALKGQISQGKLRRESPSSRQSASGGEPILPPISEELRLACFEVDNHESLFERLKQRCRDVFIRDHHSIEPSRTRSIPPASTLARLRNDFRRTSRADARFEPSRNIHPEQSMEETLMCHARLYVFADRYDCATLRSFVLARLKMTLAAFMVFEERVCDFFSLVRYVYANTVERDEIRRLLIDFGTCIVPTLAEHPLWKSCYDTIPEYARELHCRLKQTLGIEKG